jgi:hypothetical protein
LYRVPARAWVCPVCVAAAPVGERPQSYYDMLPCSVCCSRGRSATMLVCDGCDQGFHMHCMGMAGCETAASWCLVLHAVFELRGRGNRPAHFFHPPGREGPWRLRYGWCMMVLFVCLQAVKCRCLMIVLECGVAGPVGLQGCYVYVAVMHGCCQILLLGTRCRCPWPSCSLGEWVHGCTNAVLRSGNV